MSGNTIKDVALRHGLRLGGRLEESLEFEAPTFAYDGSKLWDVSLGAYTTVSQESDVVRARIGRYCSIGAYCLIGAGAHPLDRLTTSSVTYTPGAEVYQDSPFRWFGEVSQHEPWASQRLVTIGHDVFIGSRAIVLEGVTIGVGAVIGAGAVVTRDVEPYAIALGTPARAVRRRFDPSIVDRLLALRWWDYDLRLWINAGSMPKTSGLDHAVVDQLEQAIAAGEAPRLCGLRSRIYRGPDRSWRFETNLQADA